MDAVEPYEKLVRLLDAHGATYRIVSHPPEGRTALVSDLRGHAVSQAAKCVVLMVKTGRKSTLFVLAVVAGDVRVDTRAIRDLFGATYAGFAPPDIAERLSGCQSGTILPFSFDPQLLLIVDPGLLANDEIFFNAARLDRSVALRTSDYVAIATPRLAPIAGASRVAE